MKILLSVLVLAAGMVLAQGDPPTPAGWSFDDKYRSAGVLRYTSPDGTVRVELSGQAETELSATEWLDEYASRYEKDHEILLLTDASRDEDIINEAKAARGEVEVVDAAFLEIIKRYKNNPPERHILAAVVRPQEPVQLSMVQLSGESPDLEAYLGSAERLTAQSAMAPLDADAALEAALSGVDLSKLAEQTKARVEAELEQTEELPSKARKKKAGASFLPPELSNMWFIYNSKKGSKWAVMTFSDGTLTTDVNSVLSSGVDSSRRENPDRWARYTVPGGTQIMAQFPSAQAPRKYFKSDPSIRMNSDFKLTGCFTSQNTSSMGLSGLAGSSASISFGTFCFDRNGRFSNDRSFAIGSAGGNGSSLGTRTGGSHGTYTIRGNSVVFTYTDGKVLKTVFGAYRFGEKNIFAISIGSSMYIS